MTVVFNNPTVRRGGIVKDGLVVNFDAADTFSYPRTGTRWNDLSGNGNHGTLINGPTFDSANGLSIIFNSANNNYINIPNSSSQQIIDDLTIIFWFMPFNFSASRQGILGRNGLNEYTITVESNGNMSLYFNSAGQPGNYFNNASNRSFGLTNNVWHQLAITRNWTTNLVTFYKNGNQVGGTVSLAGVAKPTATSGPTGIGNGNGGSFNGRIGIYNLYNRALSAYEVRQNFDAHRSRFGI